MHPSGHPDLCDNRKDLGPVRPIINLVRDAYLSTNAQRERIVAMDTLHFDLLKFENDPPRRIDELNLSELEVFMLRGRRLQAQTIGAAWRRGSSRLRRLLRSFHPSSGSGRHSGWHRHA
jgi:hypothetical protein